MLIYTPLYSFIHWFHAFRPRGSGALQQTQWQSSTLPCLDACPSIVWSYRRRDVPGTWPHQTEGCRCRYRTAMRQAALPRNVVLPEQALEQVQALKI